MALGLWLIWAVQMYNWPLSLLFIPCTTIVMSFGTVLFGKALYTENLNCTGLGWVFLILASLAGGQLKREVKRGEFRFILEESAAWGTSSTSPVILPATWNPATPEPSISTAFPPEKPALTRSQLYAAILDVNIRATQLRKKRAKLNVQSANAVKRFNVEVIAYNQRNREVKALSDNFQERIWQ
ncbi:MAG: hypothetical protein V4710_19040 [Verrucomicrobiota bacterium]